VSGVVEQRNENRTSISSALHYSVCLSFKEREEKTDNLLRKTVKKQLALKGIKNVSV